MKHALKIPGFTPVFWSLEDQDGPRHYPASSTVSMRHPKTTKAALTSTRKRESSRDVNHIPLTQPNKRTQRNVQDDRLETDVLLAIKPVHLANIVAMEKSHEFRNYRLKDGVERLWLYETAGDGKDGRGRSAITCAASCHMSKGRPLTRCAFPSSHIAVIPSTTRLSPGEVPEHPFGIGNADFNAGLKLAKYAYPILSLHELTPSIPLEEMKTQWGMGVPMGRCYVRRDLWDARWGDPETRMTWTTMLFDRADERQIMSE